MSRKPACAFLATIFLAMFSTLLWVDNSFAAEQAANGEKAAAAATEGSASVAKEEAPAVLSTEFVTQKVSAVTTLIDKVIEFGVQYGFQILGALLILLVGYLLSRWAMGLVVALLEKKNIDITTRTFIGKAVKMMVLLIAIIIALGNFGVSISPMIAAIGALTFGATIALQGPISNYGAGFCIILTHPFRVGNTIEIQGVSGVVEEIRLASTILSTGDGEHVTIPNHEIVGKVITNSFELKVCCTGIGISYADDPQKAIEIIESVLDKTEDVSTEREPLVGIIEFGDSSVNLQARFWVPTRKYFTVLHKVNLDMYQALLKAGISIPFPQREVRMLQDEK